MSIIVKSLAAASAASMLYAVAGSYDAPEQTATPDTESIAQNKDTDCSTVRCLDTCPDGYEKKGPKGKDCCGRCVKKGKKKKATKCKEASDCEGLPHIMCVGSWSCEEKTCSYTCDDTSP